MPDQPDGFSNFYSEEERAVFNYVLDGEARYADPMAVQRRLTVALGGNPNGVIGQSNSDDPLARCAAEERLWPAVRRAFGLPDFDPRTGQGTTDTTCQRLLDDFLDYVNQKKTTRPPSPTTSPPTAPLQGRTPSTTPPVTASG